VSISQNLYLLYHNNDRRLKYGEIGVVDRTRLKRLASLRFYHPVNRTKGISGGMHLVVRKIKGKEYFFISCYDYTDNEPKIMIFENKFN
jgi:hypothetical protein